MLLPAQCARYELWGEPKESSGSVPGPRSVLMPLNPGACLGTPGRHRREHRKLMCPSLAEEAYQSDGGLSHTTCQPSWDADPGSCGTRLA